MHVTAEETRSIGCCGQPSYEGSQRVMDRKGQQENRKEMHLELWSIQGLRLSFSLLWADTPLDCLRHIVLLAFIGNADYPNWVTGYTGAIVDQASVPAKRLQGRF